MKKFLQLLIAAALLLSNSFINAQDSKPEHLLLNPFGLKQKQSNVSLDRNGRNDFTPSTNRILTNINRHLKQIISYWNVVNAVWDYSDSSRFTFNSSGNVTQEINYNQTGSYNSKYTYLYNGGGLMTEKLWQIWDVTMWRNNGKYTFSYNSNGKITEELYQHWNSSLSNWENSARYDYTYNSNGDEVENVGQQWDMIANDWKNSYRLLYNYNLNNQCSELIFQFWNDIAILWDNEFKVDYTYSISGVCNSGLSYSWVGSAWQYDIRAINVVWYNWTGNILSPDNKLSSDLQQLWDGSSWVDNDSVYYSYDAFGNETNYIDFTWQNNAWVLNDEENHIYSYDANNNITQDIWQNWNSNMLSLENYKKSDYSEYQVFTSVQDHVAPENEISIFPNPSHSSATVRFDRTADLDEIVVYNVLGNVVMTKKTGKHSTSIILDKIALPSGIYFIHAIKKNAEIAGVVKWVVE